jgi:hypothetical protein
VLLNVENTRTVIFLKVHCFSRLREGIVTSAPKQARTPERQLEEDQI